MTTDEADITAFFFFNDTATTEIYTLSLHDALPISHDLAGVRGLLLRMHQMEVVAGIPFVQRREDRKSTRLNSSHGYISYAVFCLKKKKDRQSGDDRSVKPRALLCGLQTDNGKEQPI